jgi:aminomethyltransferase
VIEIAGKDGLDLLHRLSTNDLEHLPIWTHRSTVFTSAIGRVIDVTQVIHRAQDVLLMTTASQATVVFNWIGQHVFFQDDVILSQSELAWVHWGIYGANATALVAEMLKLAELPKLHEIIEFDDGLIWAVDKPVMGVEFLNREDNMGAMRELFESASIESNAAFDVLRIENGIPRFGQEVTERSIPLEAGLRGSISFSKGCYIGQEIIARMDSRSQYSRELMGVHLRDQAEPGLTIRLAERDIGELTSSAQSQLLGWIGLAVVRSGHQAGTEVEIGPQNVSGVLASLPFGDRPGN